MSLDKVVEGCHHGRGALGAIFGFLQITQESVDEFARAQVSNVGSESEHRGT